jgi:hypothetical protein
MNSFKKIFFKYTLITLVFVFLIHTTFTIAQQSFRKLIESDRLFLFLLNNTMLNLDKLSNYQPTIEEKDKLNKVIKKINENWKMNEGP